MGLLSVLVEELRVFEEPKKQEARSKTRSSSTKLTLHNSWGDMRRQMLVFAFISLPW
jgi:hypothetical protein